MRLIRTSWRWITLVLSECRGVIGLDQTSVGNCGSRPKKGLQVHLRGPKWFIMRAFRWTPWISHDCRCWDHLPVVNIRNSDVVVMWWWCGVSIASDCYICAEVATRRHQRETLALLHGATGTSAYSSKQQWHSKKARFRWSISFHFLASERLSLLKAGNVSYLAPFWPPGNSCWQ